MAVAVDLGSRACQAWRVFELALVDLEAAEPRAGELVLVLAIARDRLALHHLQPYRFVLEEHGFDEPLRTAA